MIERKHVCMLTRVPKCTLVPPTAGTFTTQKLCKLRELFLPCAWHQGSAQGLRSDKRLRAERARVRGVVCHPFSVFILCWQCAHMTLTLALLLYMPFHVFMYCPNRFDPFILFMDVISFMNIMISFVTGYVNHNKLVVLQPRLIAGHYLTNSFRCDLVGMLPLQLIRLFDDCRYPSSTVLLSLKLCRLPTFWKEWQVFLQQVQLPYGRRRLASLILQVVLFFHWTTYLHYQLPCLLVHYIKPHPEYSWWVDALERRQNLHDSPLKKYIVNLFRSSGICFGAGYSSTEDDKYLVCDLLLTSLIGLAGLLFMTYIQSTILLLAIYETYDKNLLDGRMIQLRDYMSYKRLPQYIQRKIRMFIDYKFNGHYYNESIIMSTINEQLKQDINMYGAKKLVMKVPIFQDMPISLVNAVIFRLTQVLFMPGQVLVKYGEAGNSLFLISSGTVAVMNATGKEMAHLKDGAYFGMTALLFPGTERSATVVALEITEIYSLDYNSLQTCLQPYPHLKRRIEDGFHKLRMRL